MLLLLLLLLLLLSRSAGAIGVRRLRPPVRQRQALGLGGSQPSSRSAAAANRGRSVPGTAGALRRCGPGGRYLGLSSEAHRGVSSSRRRAALLLGVCRFAAGLRWSTRRDCRVRLGRSFVLRRTTAGERQLNPLDEVEELGGEASGREDKSCDARVPAGRWGRGGRGS